MGAGSVSKRRADRRVAPRARRRWLVPLVVAVGTALFAGGAYLVLRDGEALGSGPSVSNTPPVRGHANAPVTPVQYGDFQCPSCGAFTRGVEPELVRRYIDTSKAK